MFEAMKNSPDCSEVPCTAKGGTGGEEVREMLKKIFQIKNLL
jgi:hypothetical protein